MKNAQYKMKNKNLQSEICNLQFAMRQQGFSLIELLIAMVVASIVGMAGYVIFSSSNWSYKVQEDVSEVQQNVRVAMDRVAKDIRLAGFGLPDPPFSLTIGGQTFTSPITVTNSATGPDTITIVGIGYAVGTLDTTSAVVNCGNGIQANNSGANCIRLGTPAADTIDKFFPGGTFSVNRIHISLGGARYFQLNVLGAHNQVNRTLVLGAPATLDRNYPDGTPVYIIHAVQYSIETNDPGASPPCTMANPCLRSQDLTTLRGSGSQTFAENIEDIQFAYGIDASPKDGKIDYTAPYVAAAFQNNPTDPTSIIAVRANIVGKTRNQDPKGATGFRSKCFEDRPADTGTTNCTGAVSDGYRRRALTKIIKIRNPRQGA